MPRVTASPQEALRNAAELLLLLDDDEAQSVLSQLSSREVNQVRAAIRGIDPHHSLFGDPATGAVDINLDAPMQAQASVPADVPGGGLGSEAFQAEPQAQVGASPGGFSASRMLSEPGHYAQGMLRQALGAAASFSASSGARSTAPASRGETRTGGDGLARLKRTDLATVAHYLAGEHPQISAVVLAWLERDVAARILQLVPPRLRNELMLRIAHLGQVQSAALQDLQEALADILTLHEARKEGPHGGVLTAVQLLTRLGAHLEGPMMEAIRAQDPSMAQRISERLQTARKSGLGAPAAA